MGGCFRMTPNGVPRDAPWISMFQDLYHRNEYGLQVGAPGPTHMSLADVIQEPTGASYKAWTIPEHGAIITNSSYGARYQLSKRVPVSLPRTSRSTCPNSISLRTPCGLPGRSLYRITLDGFTTMLFPISETTYPGHSWTRFSESGEEP